MIRLEFKQYFQILSVQMTLAKKLNEEYDKAASQHSPSRQNRSDSDDSAGDDAAEESTIILERANDDEEIS